MTFDLGLAMHKKQEFESARLDDFDFRCRVRAARLLARAHGADEDAAATCVASVGPEALAHGIAALLGAAPEEVAAAYRTCLAQARADLLRERGDPAPHRLA